MTLSLYVLSQTKWMLQNANAPVDAGTGLSQKGGMGG